MGARLIALMLTTVFLTSGAPVGAEQAVFDYPGVRSAPEEPRVVVGIIDTAINPYHEFFYRHPSSVTDEVLAEFAVLPENVVELTRTGDFESDFAADAAFWDRVERGVPYHFVGTNIIATSMGRSGPDRLAPLASKDLHGVGVSASVLLANPDAILFFVDLGTWDNWPDIREIHEVPLLHPAVDIFSASYSIKDPATGVVSLLPESRARPAMFEAVVERGKLSLTAVGNNPGAAPLTGHAGPWWSIGIGGIEEDTPNSISGEPNGEGQQLLLAGNLPDFVADFTPEPLPWCMECESGTWHQGRFAIHAGTSFSAPRAAGVASKVLLEARRVLGHIGGITEVDGEMVMAAGEEWTISNWAVRRALEEAAWIPRTEDYAPLEGETTEMMAVPVNAVAPWLQVAWGELSPKPEKGVVSAALAHLGFEGEPRIKTVGFCEFQTEVIRFRRLYWESVAPQIPINWYEGGDVSGGGPDPFIYCASGLPHHPPSNDPGAR